MKSRNRFGHVSCSSNSRCGQTVEKVRRAGKLSGGGNMSSAIRTLIFRLCKPEKSSPISLSIIVRGSGLKMAPV